MDIVKVESCFELASFVVNRPESECTVFEIPKDDEETCKFNFDSTQTGAREVINLDLPAGIKFGDLEWSCSLYNRSLSFCNGVSECLTDECGCHDSEIDVFYCADGSGCIAWSGLCDDIQDCMDGSDECFCAGHLVIPALEIGGKVCMSEQSFCMRKAYLVLGNESEAMQMKYCEDSKTSPQQSLTPLETCLRDAFESFRQIYWFSPSRIQEYCRENCSYVSKFDDGWTRFCKHVERSDFGDFNFVCDNDSTEFYHISKICDGQVDCSNEGDEIGCPLSERFYCQPNVTSEWLSNDKVCDDVKDCANGSMELTSVEHASLKHFHPQSFLSSQR